MLPPFKALWWKRREWGGRSEATGKEGELLEGISCENTWFKFAHTEKLTGPVDSKM